MSSFSQNLHYFILIRWLKIILHVHTTSQLIKLIFNHFVPNFILICNWGIIDIAHRKIRPISLFLKLNHNEVVIIIIFEVKAFQITKVPMFGFKNILSGIRYFLLPFHKPILMSKTDGKYLVNRVKDQYEKNPINQFTSFFDYHGFKVYYFGITLFIK